MESCRYYFQVQKNKGRVCSLETQQIRTHLAVLITLGIYPVLDTSNATAYTLGGHVGKLSFLAFICVPLSFEILLFQMNVKGFEPSIRT